MRLSILSRLVQAFHDRVLKPEGIPHTDYQILGLVRILGPRTPKQLNEILMRTTAGVTNSLDRLEKGGSIRRRPSPTDRRSVLVELTATGRKLAERLERAESEAQANALGTLGAKDRDDLLRSLDLLIEILAPTRP